MKNELSANPIGGKPSAGVRSGVPADMSHAALNPSLTLLDTVDLVRLLGVHKQTVYNWVRSGKLKPVRLGPRRFRFKLSDVESLIASASLSK